MHNDSPFWRSGAFLRPRENQIFLFELETPSDAFRNLEWLSFFDKTPTTMSARKVQKIQGPWSFPEDYSEAHLRQEDFSQSDPKEFADSFQMIQSAIQHQTLRKAVPIARRTVKRTAKRNLENTGSFDRVSTSWMNSVLRAPTSLFPFGFWNANQGIVGATPEVLFYRSGSSVQTMALAGTLIKSKDIRPQNLQDFLNDPKERAEHQFVVQDLVDKLSRYGKVHTHPIEVFELPTLFHLRTKVNLELKPMCEYSKIESELMMDLHPTPALGVSPRSALDWFRSLPLQNERHLFGGPVLFRWGADESLCLVMIRNIQWQGEEYSIFAGCGVVEQSLENREWTELQKKMDSVFQILGIP